MVVAGVSCTANQMPTGAGGRTIILSPSSPRRAGVRNFLFERAPGGDAVPAEYIDEAATTEKLPLKVGEESRQRSLYI
jgi:hypothetical protein